MATVLDPLLVIIVDLAMHNYSCATYSSACKADYTSNDCACYIGDFQKLWVRLLASEGSGIAGAIITICLYIGTSVLALLSLYEYLVYVHKDARILDLWRRTRAPMEEFFCPDDFEVSHEELTSVCAKAHGWRGLTGR